MHRPVHPRNSQQPRSERALVGHTPPLVATDHLAFILFTAVKFVLALTLTTSAFLTATKAQNVTRDIPYAEPVNERQTLDIHAPAAAKELPVVFWIHGGGWENGDKTRVTDKPRAFMEKGFVFVSTNHRFRPHVPMEEIVRDIARSIRWVHDHIARYGGDPTRIFVMGHSSGAQLAALICTDDRYLKAEGLSLRFIKACVPVDGDTYDVPLMIATAEARRKERNQPEPKFGHRAKFGTPDRHYDLSAVNHVARDKGIPPFLLIHVAGHADTTAQARRLHHVLTAAGISATLFAGHDTDHLKINHHLGRSDDEATQTLFSFVATALQP